MLIFNIEFGYFEVGGKEVEERVVFLVKEKNDWIYLKWVKQVICVFIVIENVIWFDLFIVGGGISCKVDKWVLLLENCILVVFVVLQNIVGIVGVVMVFVVDMMY